MILQSGNGLVVLCCCQCAKLALPIYIYDLLGVRFVFVFWNLFAVFESFPSNEQGQTQNFWLA